MSLLYAQNHQWHVYDEHRLTSVIVPAADTVWLLCYGGAECPRPIPILVIIILLAFITVSASGLLEGDAGFSRTLERVTEHLIRFSKENKLQKSIRQDTK